MTAVIVGPKSYQKLMFKAVKNRKRRGYVDCQQVGSIDVRNLFYSKLKLLIETMMTIVDKVNNDKTKVLDFS